MSDCMVSDQDGCCVGCGLSITAIANGRETCHNVPNTGTIRRIEKHNQRNRALATLEKEETQMTMVYDSSIPEVLRVGRTRVTELTLRG